MLSAIHFFRITEVLLLEPREGKMHWRLSFFNESDVVETWALHAAWKSKNTTTPILTRLPRHAPPPWLGSFSLGPITLYPRQARTIEVFTDEIPDATDSRDWELHGQFFFDERFGGIQISNIVQVEG